MTGWGKFPPDSKAEGGQWGEELECPRGGQWVGVYPRLSLACPLTVKGGMGFDPETDFHLCLRRTLSTASHETGHILGMAHCTAYSCLMNGSNHQEEKDRRPMHLCPVCLRKLCWNLQVEP